MERTEIMPMTKPKVLVGMIATAFVGLTSMAHADIFSERLKNDPTAIHRPKPQTYGEEPMFTGSMKKKSVEQPSTDLCSYDTFYWNTIYACDPEHQGNTDFSKSHGDRD
jgi:hypothetical protein